MEMNKPHKGTLDQWKKHPTYIGGYFFTGKFVDHPEFAGKKGHTSRVVAQEGYEVETLNSRYTLGDPLLEDV